jgi:hypothetical protein
MMMMMVVVVVVMGDDEYDTAVLNVAIAPLGASPTTPKSLLNLQQTYTVVTSKAIFQVRVPVVVVVLWGFFLSV